MAFQKSEKKLPSGYWMKQHNREQIEVSLDYQMLTFFFPALLKPLFLYLLFIHSFIYLSIIYELKTCNSFNYLFNYYLSVFFFHYLSIHFIYLQRHK